MQQPLRYMARELDPLTGLPYVRNRMNEAIHGVRNPASRLGNTFGDGPVPPFASVNAAAQFCLGN
jgi:hypothetical protein